MPKTRLGFIPSVPGFEPDAAGAARRWSGSATTSGSLDSIAFQRRKASVTRGRRSGSKIVNVPPSFSAMSSGSPTFSFAYTNK